MKKKYKAKVEYHDPFVPVINKMRNYNFLMKSIKITSKKIKAFDAVIIVTDHDKFNYKIIRENSKLLVDTRGIIKKKYPNVISA